MLAILIAVVVIAGAAAACVVTGRRKYVNGQPEGMGGWLMAFVLLLIANILGFIFGKAQQILLLTEADSEGDIRSALLFAAFDFNLFSMLLAVVSVIMLLRRDSWAPSVMLCYVVLQAVFSGFGVAMLFWYAPERAWTSAGAAEVLEIFLVPILLGVWQVVYAIAWTLYANRSVRVANTYREPPDDLDLAAQGR